MRLNLQRSFRIECDYRVFDSFRSSYCVSTLRLRERKEKGENNEPDHKLIAQKIDDSQQ